MRLNLKLMVMFRFLFMKMVLLFVLLSGVTGRSGKKLFKMRRLPVSRFRGRNLIICFWRRRRVVKFPRFRTRLSKPIKNVQLRMKFFLLISVMLLSVFRVSRTSVPRFGVNLTPLFIFLMVPSSTQVPR